MKIRIETNCLLVFSLCRQETDVAKNNWDEGSDESLAMFSNNLVLSKGKIHRFKVRTGCVIPSKHTYSLCMQKY